MEYPSYYGILPATVRYDKNLKPMEKIMYTEITALSNKYGYCNASNNYFAKLYEVHKNTISSWISNLKNQGYIRVEVLKNSETNEVEERRIYLVGIPINEKIDTPINKNVDTPINKKIEYNNTSMNNTSINNTYVTSETEKVKEKVQQYRQVIAELIRTGGLNTTVDQVIREAGRNKIELEEVVNRVKAAIKSEGKNPTGLLIGSLKNNYEIKAKSDKKEFEFDKKRYEYLKAEGEEFLTGKDLEYLKQCKEYLEG